jgi:hypothetical protein
VSEGAQQRTIHPSEPTITVKKIMAKLLGYQQRVIEEKEELFVRLGKLEVFLTTLQFSELPEAEQERLKRQQAVMEQYLGILNERIDAWR